MKDHPAAAEFPMMGKKRYLELLEDIKENGLRLPIILCDGFILDGRNRFRACRELNMKPRFEQFEGNPWALIWSHNGIRRDITDGQRYLIWKQCSEKSEAWQAEQMRIQEEANAKRSESKKGKLRLEGQNNARPTSPRTSKNPSRKAKAKASRTNTGAVKVGDWLEAHRPDLAEKVRRGKMKMAKAKKQADREARELELKQAQALISAEKRARLESVCEIRHCSCAELLASGIKADLIITDPPYPEKFLPVFEELAVGAAQLKIQLVAVMIGQSCLPKILEIMSKHLSYLWIFAYMTPGGQSVQLWQRRINTFWKPVLLFGSLKNWVGDVVVSKSNDNDKRFHNWGQSESGMADLVEKISKPGQTICDPFLGGGTTAIVALARGRKFIGCDTDKKNVEQSMARIAGMEI